MNKQRKTKEERRKTLERTVSAEERIRRAEEIYQRRRTQGDVRVSSSHVNTKERPNYFLFKKLILQIMICLLIYFIFYLIQNSNYIFSEEVLKKTREFLSYDINFQNLYYQTEAYMKQFWEQNTKKEEQTQEVTNEETIEESNEEVEGGIGGGEEGTALLTNEMLVTPTEEASQEIPLTQMEIDAKNIKENYNLGLPLQGPITSHFGPREPTEIVSANHAGVDIGAKEGTVFVASMEGTVTYVSSEGGYGNHLSIEKDDVTTLYAHCSKIYVKEGDTISQGQQIGEVGQTGNTTGPHLHFEIRKENRLVNPELVVSF